MNYSNDAAQHETIYDSWMDLIGMAQDTIEIASFYWTMKREDVFRDDSAKKVSDICYDMWDVDIVWLKLCALSFNKFIYQQV